MDLLVDEFARAYTSFSGHQLSETLSPVAPLSSSDFLTAVWKSTIDKDVKAYLGHWLSSNAYSAKPGAEEVKGWVEVYAAYLKALGEILAVQDPASAGKTSSWAQVYDAWKDLSIALQRGYSNHSFEAWTTPCLYVVGKHLRLFAVRSDEERASSSNEAVGASFQDDADPDLEEQQSLRDCEQQLKRMFTLCLNDRSSLQSSRKWAIYYIINLLFKTYFKLNSTSLSRTILKALSAYQGDMPDLTQFPKSQRVTFKFYEGVLFFLEENYVEAEQHLTEAWGLCHKDATANQEKILTYLIPCHVLTSHTLPTQKLLQRFPRLRDLFLPLSQSIKRGNLHDFDIALRTVEDELVRQRIYLTLERGRDIAMRNLLRRVFMAGDFEETTEAGAPLIRRTRVPVAEFQAALIMSNNGQSIDADEVECILANMIYKNLMKGYIHRDRGIVAARALHKHREMYVDMVPEDLYSLGKWTLHRL